MMWTTTAVFLLISMMEVPLHALQCLNGFEANINGTKEFEIKSVVLCPEDSRFCVTGFNNMVKNVFLVGFTEMRVFGCEGQRVQYTADVMPRCPDAGWLRIYDHIRHCCEGDGCNIREHDPEGFAETLDVFGLKQDFFRYVAK